LRRFLVGHGHGGPDRTIEREPHPVSPPRRSPLCCASTGRAIRNPLSIGTGMIQCLTPECGSVPMGCVCPNRGCFTRYTGVI
jgi:hypothetical protein